MFHANAERKSRDDAKDFCEGDGAALAVALTVDDMDALEHYEQKAGSKLWIGLKGNADLKNICMDNQCSYLLDWDDGTRFIFSSLNHSIEGEEKNPCMTYRGTAGSSSRLKGPDADTMKRFSANSPVQVRT